MREGYRPRAVTVVKGRRCLSASGLGHNGASLAARRVLNKAVLGLVVGMALAGESACCRWARADRTAEACLDL